MAIAAYDSDLTSANGGELTTASNAVNWDESTDGAWDDGGTMVDETNFYIQGAECISAQFTKTGVGTIINIQGTSFTVDTDGAILIWAFWASPTSLTTYASGGIRTLVGNTLGDFYAYKASGSDFLPNPIGGWALYAIDPASATIDSTAGAPSGTWTHAGVAINATAQSRGNPFAVDAIRVGRCTLEVTLGDATGYGTFAGMSSFSTSTNQRYGVFQKIFGGYKWQGLMQLGTAATAVDFRDANANVFVENVPQVSAAFNRIEVNNTASNVEWTSIGISSQDGVDNTVAATASRGNFEVVDNATLLFTSCTFTDMGTFIFNDGANTNTINSTTFRRCDKITTGGAAFDSCIIDSSFNATVAITASSPANAAKITNSAIISAGTGNGLEITGTAANITLTGLDFTGYSTTVDADKAIYVNIATGSVELNISGGSGISAATDVRTAGATVTVVSGAVNVKVSAITDTGVAIENARVLLQASDGTGPFPYQETVTIANSSTTATVTHTAHGMASNDYVAIKAASLAANNGVFQITVTDANTYTYTMGSAPGSSPTGTILATFAAIYGVTDVNGEISVSRVYSADQPVSGWTRKSTSSPFYKQGALNGTILSASGLTLSGVMVSDE